MKAQYILHFQHIIFECNVCLGWEEFNTCRESETVIGETRTKPFEKISELPQALFELLKNLSFVFLNLAGCCESILLSGSGTFLPKIIEVQFHLNSKLVAIVMGK